ncbi:hypothetical protein FGW37_29265 [Streptomyces rectiverticillatus]|uniref:RICIN domain-containing protein n=1 Tax=Streptomyces rectiverticillatus TaxID=173860 RepID=UPI0015C366E0|nr:hypothetical protein [Streptomyces rectiverticillatus]QLE75151.1 hypothetical protein FGW37_29265 [Streptomyces rectiverticillatus]
MPVHPLVHPLTRRSAILVAAATMVALAPGVGHTAASSPAPIKNEGAGWYLDSGTETSSAKAPTYTAKYTGEPASAPGNLKWSYDPATKLIKNEANGWYLGSGGDSSSAKAPAYTTKYNGDPAAAPPQLKWSYDASTKLVKNEGNGWYLGTGGDDYGKAPAYTTKYTGSPASAPAQLKWAIAP